MIICLIDVQVTVQAQERFPPKYHQAAKIKKLIKEDIFGKIEDQFQKLPALVDAIRIADPQACAFLDISDEAIFIRFFWSSAAAKEFLTFQRPLLSLDAGWTKHSPKGNFLCLSSEDMECRQEILAITITQNEESEAEWSLFLQRCLQHIPELNSPTIGIITDRAKGLDNYIWGFPFWLF